MAEVSKAPSVMQLQGNKNPQIGSPPKLTGLNLTRGTSTNEDEFKYGFPSHGLSTVSYKWWGNSSNSGSKDTPGTAKDETQGNRKSPVNSANGSTLASRTDGQKCENEARESSTDSPGEGVLSSLRKKLKPKWNSQKATCGIPDYYANCFHFFLFVRMHGNVIFVVQNLEEVLVSSAGNPLDISFTFHPWYAFIFSYFG